MNNQANDIYVEIAKNFINHIIKKENIPLESALLGGSAGRGEAALLHWGNREILLSDLDLYLFAKNPSPQKKVLIDREIKKFIQTIDKDFEISPFFHISAPLGTPESLVKAWKNLRFFEMLHSASVIYGPDFRTPRMKEEIVSLDPIFTYRLLIERVMQQILFNKFCVCQDDYLHHYFFCRNIAELATIVLYTNNEYATSYILRTQLLGSYVDELKRVAPGFDWPRILKNIQWATEVKTRPTPEKICKFTREFYAKEMHYGFLGVFVYLKNKFGNIFDYSIGECSFLPLKTFMGSIYLFSKKPRYYLPNLLEKEFLEMLPLITVPKERLKENEIEKIIRPYYYRTRHKDYRKGDLS